MTSLPGHPRDEYTVGEWIGGTSMVGGGTECVARQMSFGKFFFLGGEVHYGSFIGLNKKTDNLPRLLLISVLN